MTEEYKATVSRAGGGGEGTEARKAKAIVGNSDKHCQGLLCSRATVLAEGVFVRDGGRRATV